MQIKSIPNRIKKFVMLNKKVDLRHVGFKKINSKKKIVIIELSNRYRVWILRKEI
uniref:Cytochrome b6-f complex subunit PetP n=1 Tax=Kapraunia schneideri TaxID=717899 RepID=A0A1Z1MT31_9FLOR|nr:cytochrome b6-f complex subunit PetP [Kapraunia schneideri]ARW68941.1 cytochrome b6-f complex subunit PetP [Kapraunia schneideri]